MGAVLNDAIKVSIITACKATAAERSILFSNRHNVAALPSN